jgi:hypothetical protein
MNGKRVKGLLAAWLVGKGVLLPIAPRQRPLLWLFEHSEGGSLVKRQNFLPEMGLRRLFYFPSGSAESSKANASGFATRFAWLSASTALMPPSRSVLCA